MEGGSEIRQVVVISDLFPLLPINFRELNALVKDHLGLGRCQLEGGIPGARSGVEKRAPSG